MTQARLRDRTSRACYCLNSDLSRATLRDGSLYLEAKSSSLAGSSPLLCIPVNHSYSLQWK